MSGTQISGYGLQDLIEGMTPTYSGWTANPTDGDHITDNDITTSCTTGNLVTGGAWESAYMTWDLGKFHNLMISGVGGINVSAGEPRGYIALYNGSDWISGILYAFNSSAHAESLIFAGMGSKIRLRITGSVASTITPNIRELHAWRLI